MRLGITAADWLADSRQNSLLVPLGCSIDDLIGGGIQTQQILELVGQTATGKTQICLHCTLHTALVADSVTILYIDTSNAFSSKRLSEMLVKQQGTDISEEFLAFILSKIQCVKIYDAFSLLDFLDNLYKDLLELKTNFYQSLRLIVIDSLAAVISPILDGKHQILGHAIMMQIAQLMKSIAFQFHIAIIVILIFSIFFCTLYFLWFLFFYCKFILINQKKYINIDQYLHSIRIILYFKILGRRIIKEKKNINQLWVNIGPRFPIIDYY